MTEVTKMALRIACDYLASNAEIKLVNSLDGKSIMIPYNEKDKDAFHAAVLHNVLSALIKTEK